MQEFRQKPLSIKAVQNQSNADQTMTDSQGLSWLVPGTWWLVEGMPLGGAVQMMSDDSFRSTFEKYEEPAPLEGMSHTIQDLRHTDRLTTVQMNAMDDRLRAVEAWLQAAPGGPAPTPA